MPAVPVPGPTQGQSLPRVLPALLAVLGLLTLLAVLPTWASGAGPVLRVGPAEALKRPSDAARVAPDGATVEIAAGDYFGDVAVWPQHRLTLRGTGGIAHLHADGQAAEAKAIWVIKGNDVTVENIAFSGTRVPDRNGAGIRAEGTLLVIRNCHFHHNENGLLTSNNPDAIVTITDSEFHHNILDYAKTRRLGHNLYVGQIRRFRLERSYVHSTETGHQVKSRARQNDILNNRIRDEEGGSSYLIDLPDGGQARIIGNELQQSARAPNRTAIAFGAEGNRNASFGTALTVTGNRFTNQGSPGTFVHNHTDQPAVLRHNTMQGRVTPLRGPGSVDADSVSPR